ncbi:sensor histidine kinase [Roseivirga sp. BDSF3-8]|uniref:sensor histidine kinase n=1 Tax=Roseivirga sp. BDSF3-8 TaxID=3241598 RepID=UPI0035325D2F
MKPFQKHAVTALVVMAIISGLIAYGAWLDLSTNTYIAVGWIVLLILLLVAGNRYISRFLDKVLPWKKYTSLRFAIHVLLSLVYSLLCLNISYYTFKVAFTEDPPTPYQITVMNGFGLMLVLAVILIYFSIYILKAWRRSTLEGERLQKETIKSELQALRTHLDPHFLFNNLNILDALIEKDPKAARHFLTRFSEVYRFLLKKKDAELITLTEELDFLQAYLFLIQTRFNDNVQVHMHVCKAHRDMSLPPLALQILIENCLKHNMIDEDSPLHINIISRKDGYISVSNNLRPREHKLPGTGTGLENIRNRYSYFTDRNVNIQTHEGQYIVDIPLIEVEEI